MNKLYHNAPVFSQVFLAASLMCFILNIVGHNSAFNFLALDPNRVLHNFELWRLLSYPLSTLSLASFMLLSFSIGIFSSALEVAFSTKRFVGTIASLVLAQGLVYTALCAGFSQPYVLSGGDTVSFFVMAMFVFVQPTRSVSLWRRYEVRGLSLALSFVGLSIGYRSYLAIHDGPEQLYYGVLPAIFGVVFAIMLTTVVHQQLKRVRRLNNVSHVDFMDERLIEQEEELVSSFGKSDRALSKLYYPEPQRSDEEMLNLLLDKIFEHGQESLTPEEKTFLEDYSQRMR